MRLYVLREDSVLGLLHMSSWSVGNPFYMHCRHFATEARSLIRLAHQGSGQKREFTCCVHLGARKPLLRPAQSKVASVRSFPFPGTCEERSRIAHT